MKKILALILTCALALGLCACGGNAPAASDPDVSASAPAAEAPTSEAPASEAPAAEDGAPYSGESFVIHMASDANENSDQVAPMRYFRDLIAEKSGGAVTVEIAWGGTEYDNAGIWEAMSNGLLEMDIALMNKHTADMPVMAWGFMPFSADAAESIKQTNYMLFDNPETSAIIAKYLGNANMTLLGNSSDGAPTFITTFAWNTIDELVSKCSAFGTMNTAKYQAIGLNCVAVPAPDAYDNLSRGIVDGASAPLATALTFSLNEVAPYATVDGQYTSAVMILANSAFWDGLSEEAKTLVQSCVDATSDYSAEHVTESTLDSAAEWETATGNAVAFMTGDDGKALWAQTLAAIANNSKNAAVGQPYEEDMKTLLTEWVKYQEEYHGIDVDFEW